MLLIYLHFFVFFCVKTYRTLWSAFCCCCLLPFFVFVCENLKDFVVSWIFLHFLRVKFYRTMWSAVLSICAFLGSLYFWVRTYRTLWSVVGFSVSSLGFSAAASPSCVDPFFTPYFLVIFWVFWHLSISTSLDTSASKFSPVTQNMAVSRKQKQIQVMHTVDVLYFNVIHTYQLPQSHTRTWTSFYHF